MPKRALSLVCGLLAALLLVGCAGASPGTGPAGSAAAQSGPAQPAASAASTETQEETAMKIQIEVNGHTFTATLAQTAAAAALADILREGPLTLSLQNYGGFEKVGPLGESLPASDSQTTTHAGDIVLYQGDQIVLFYGSNSWSYTRLGRVDNLTGWADALGHGDVTVTLSLAG